MSLCVARAPDLSFGSSHDQLEAALDAELLRQEELVSRAEPLPFTRSELLVGTHEVAVRIDDETGDYALQCRSCDWTAARGPDHPHSWAERSLDVTLLHHVDFGDLQRAEGLQALSASQSAQIVAAEYGPRMRDEGVDGPRGPAAEQGAVARRTFFSPARWVKPHHRLD